MPSSGEMKKRSITEMTDVDMKRIFFVLPLLLSCRVFLLSAQEKSADIWPMPEYLSNDYRQKIYIPDVGEYKILKCDLHTHTVFSDGGVWPTVRVEEAWSEGLDAVAITDHIEYRPRKDILKGDLNQAYILAKKRADEIGFLVIKGTEITRSKPVGHMNALFVEDANRLEVKNAADAVEEAHRQGAVVMLNHPGWPDNKSTIDTMHIRLMKENKIQLIEVFNTSSFYPKVTEWANEYKLGYVASSDMHGTSANRYLIDKVYRPMTLVFSKSHSLDGIKEALLARRTVAFFNQHLSGSEENLNALFKACVSAKIVSVNENKKRYIIEVENKSDILFVLKSGKGQPIRLLPQKTYRMFISIPNVSREYTILNAHTGLDKCLKVRLPILNLAEQSVE